MCLVQTSTTIMNAVTLSPFLSSLTLHYSYAHTMKRICPDGVRVSFVLPSVAMSRAAAVVVVVVVATLVTDKKYRHIDI